MAVEYREEHLIVNLGLGFGPSFVTDDQHNFSNYQMRLGQTVSFMSLTYSFFDSVIQKHLFVCLKVEGRSANKCLSKRRFQIIQVFTIMYMKH